MCVTHCLCDVEEAASDGGALAAHEEAEVAGSRNQEEATGDPCQHCLLEALGQVRICSVQSQVVILVKRQNI